VAQEVGADSIAHGCTGKGNDQVRFEVTAQAIAPDLKVIAPLREWELTTRESEIEFAEARGIPVPVKRASPYSLDENLWGCAIECGVLEDLWAEAPDDAWRLTTDPARAPKENAIIILGFERGFPVSLDGERLSGPELISRLNVVAGRYGIGRIDMVENRVVGLKSREIYEAPGATGLHLAHRDLERVVLDRATAHYKAKIAQDFATLIYDGLWFGALREALLAFVDRTQERVTGEVRMRLSAGVARAVARRSPYSLYDEGLATYSHGDTFDRSAAVGFLKLYGLPYRTLGSVRRKERT
jgi:argininosuccinate synthase